MIMVQTFRTEQLDNLFHANTTQLHWENQNSALPIIAEVPTLAIGTKSSQVIFHPSTMTDILTAFEEQLFQACSKFCPNEYFDTAKS